MAVRTGNLHRPRAAIADEPDPEWLPRKVDHPDGRLFVQPGFIDGDEPTSEEPPLHLSGEDVIGWHCADSLPSTAHQIGPNDAGGALTLRGR